MRSQRDNASEIRATVASIPISDIGSRVSESFGIMNVSRSGPGNHPRAANVRAIGGVYRPVSTNDRAAAGS